MASTTKHGTYSCPDCPDCTEFKQTTVQYERVTADDTGEPETFTVTHLDTIEITCSNCETVIYASDLTIERDTDTNK